ncbi:MAG TPA: SET domain-containing protein-lysine N-methyltransferase, partial [Steroidobacteraceae bacterium]|nr:SET domain-containing protein-lysine N-methyltransferase [Steroidobacteraceae bacterium]
MSSVPRREPAPLIAVGDSPLHGLGVFALRGIARGTRVVEYLGERISHAEADRRYRHKDALDNHTFLFIVDARTVIDAGIGGNEARFVNHACEP